MTCSEIHGAVGWLGTAVVNWLSLQRPEVPLSTLIDSHFPEFVEIFKSFALHNLVISQKILLKDNKLDIDKTVAPITGQDQNSIHLGLQVYSTRGLSCSH